MFRFFEYIERFYCLFLCKRSIFQRIFFFIQLSFQELENLSKAHFGVKLYYEKHGDSSILCCKTLIACESNLSFFF